jgi:hypothetical protein
MAAAYDLAGQSRSPVWFQQFILICTKDMEVRRCISKAEVARCSFKDKAIEEVEVLFFNSTSYNVLIPIKAISLAYQVAIDAIAKCLRLFAENQQYVRFSDSFAYR